MPLGSGNALLQNIIPYTISMTIQGGRDLNINVADVTLALSLRVPICLSMSGTCSSLEVKCKDHCVP